MYFIDYFIHFIDYIESLTYICSVKLKSKFTSHHILNPKSYETNITLQFTTY